MICPHCSTETAFDAESPFCIHCDSPLSRVALNVQNEKWKSDADFLGFSEAKRMYETRNTWKKFGK